VAAQEMHNQIAQAAAEAITPEVVVVVDHTTLRIMTVVMAVRVLW
jgi:hypothetical protein